MQRFLRILQPITGALSRALIRDRLNAIQSAIHALAAGDNITTGGDLKRAPGVGRVGFSVGRGKRAYGAGSSSSGPCSFGAIVPIDDETDFTLGIAGGLITCGDKNFNVPYQGLDTDPTTNGEWLVQITLTGITCATDDDGEIFLPGVTTATGTPAWANVTYAAGPPPTSYGDTTNPTGPSAPTGDIVIPIGKLTIVDGAPTLSATGCGRITIGQCAGILNHSRG